MGKKRLLLHPKCGKRFPDSERTGHCAGCCETFFGAGAFDKHQSHKDGALVCANPATDAREWHQDEQERWHFGPEMTAERKAEIWKR